MTFGAVSKTTDWFENDALFRSELSIGHQWACFVAESLTAQDIPARVTPMEFRATIDDRHRFVNEADIVIDTTDGPIVVETKSRRLSFGNDPTSYPYPTAFVDTVDGWHKKSPPPRAVVIVSQYTKAMLVVPVEATRETWTVRTARDRVRNIVERSYECPVGRLWTFDDLITRLRLTI